jgi:hypothetical protein
MEEIDVKEKYLFIGKWVTFDEYGELRAGGVHPSGTVDNSTPLILT